METETNQTLPRSNTDPLPRLIHRDNWKRFRTKIEKDKTKSNITRFYPHRKWFVFTLLLKLLGVFVAVSGLYRRGSRNVRNLVLNRLEIPIKDLPKEFDGFEILHLTDIHFDRVVGVEKRIVKVLGDTVPDMIVMTGDYKDKMTMPPQRYEQSFSYLSKNLKSKHGIYAVLGNHDTHDLVPVMEKNGITVLLNEFIEIQKGQSKVTLTGVDDVHYYFSPQALTTLELAPENVCKILLVHSPEMVKEAEAAGYSLYLCGHTHWGQVSLPSGKPVITHVNTGKEFTVGRWTYGNLQGYTSSGAGVSGLTVRFFTQSEIALIRLRRA